MTRLKTIVPAYMILLLASSFGWTQESTTDQPFVVMDGGWGMKSGDGLESSDDRSFQTGEALPADSDATGPVGRLHGCVYNSGGSQFQAVKFKMKRAGMVRFDALLYRGASCSPDQFIDEFGFGNKLSLGAGTWIFWFIHFPGQLNTSGRWHVGKQRSQCVDYQTAPDC